MSRRKIKIYFLIIVFLVAIAATILSFTFWSMCASPVPRSTMDKIKLGMSKETVQSILGQPYKIYKINKGEEWIYGHDLKWQHFSVYFSEGGTVKGKEYDR